MVWAQLTGFSLSYKVTISFNVFSSFSPSVFNILWKQMWNALVINKAKLLPVCTLTWPCHTCQGTQWVSGTPTRRSRLPKQTAAQIALHQLLTRRGDKPWGALQIHKLRDPEAPMGLGSHSESKVPGNLRFHIIPRNTYSALGTGRQQWQGCCLTETGGTYHDLGDTVFGVFCGYTLYFPTTVYAPRIAFLRLLVAYGTPPHLLAFILWAIRA